MANQQHNTVFSIVVRIVAGLTIIAVLGGLFLDAVAATNPPWKAKAEAVGRDATLKYLRVLRAFEGVE